MTGMFCCWVYSPYADSDAESTLTEHQGAGLVPPARGRNAAPVAPSDLVSLTTRFTGCPLIPPSSPLTYSAHASATGRADFWVEPALPVSPIAIPIVIGDPVGSPAAVSSPPSVASVACSDSVVSVPPASVVSVPPPVVGAAAAPVVSAAPVVVSAESSSSSPPQAPATSANTATTAAARLQRCVPSTIPWPTPPPSGRTGARSCPGGVSGSVRSAGSSVNPLR